MQFLPKGSGKLPPTSVFGRRDLAQMMVDQGLNVQVITFCKKLVGEDLRHCGKTLDSNGHCPRCDHTLCPNCGKALDWDYDKCGCGYVLTNRRS